ncbi:hypothetical protein ARAM_006861 [Aspergillus rambellii]|uniref:Zn(2)-C6 fungal-type domain-containing protein n=1 Tax=Aspergillus rambellii TaxID=308745 RepID=A0A0F8UIN9_9EURO|nr:hypothetical protein ARAM_006861 [Aspergillus rambellii]
MADQGPPRPNFRPIAPRLVPDPPAQKNSDDGRTKRASTACAECKRRRTKCSADNTGTPCTECALHNRECIIDEFADKRRKVAAKRAQEDLKYFRGFLEQLLEAIRYGDRTNVEILIEAIRTGASHEEIHSVISKFSNIQSKIELKIPTSVQSDLPNGEALGRREPQL